MMNNGGLSPATFETINGRTRSVGAAGTTDLDGNAILDSLSPATQRLLEPHLSRAPLTVRSELREAGQTWFPLSGAVSFTLVTRGGETMDTLLVGAEGLVGDMVWSPGWGGRLVVRHPGEALRISTARLMEIADQQPDLRAAIEAQLLRMLFEAQQTALCTSAHRLEQRLATWLMRCRDRGGPSLWLNQDELAQALGVQRTTVNAAARLLKLAGVLRYSRGRITIADEAGLRRECCECYGAMHDGAAAGR